VPQTVQKRAPSASGAPQPVQDRFVGLGFGCSAGGTAGAGWAAGGGCAAGGAAGGGGAAGWAVGVSEVGARSD
jgi:hypothetical protein